MTYRRFDEPNSAISVCSFKSCQAINSPGAQACWKCKEPFIVRVAEDLEKPA
jgi:ribosomal protein L40E